MTRLRGRSRYSEAKARPSTSLSHAPSRPSLLAPTVRDDRNTPLLAGANQVRFCRRFALLADLPRCGELGTTGKSGRDSHIELHRKPFKKGVSSKKTSKTPRKAEKNCVEASSLA